MGETIKGVSLADGTIAQVDYESLANLPTIVADGQSVALKGDTTEVIKNIPAIADAINKTSDATITLKEAEDILFKGLNTYYYDSLTTAIQDINENNGYASQLINSENAKVKVSIGNNGTVNVLLQDDCVETDKISIYVPLQLNLNGHVLSTSSEDGFIRLQSNDIEVFGGLSAQGERGKIKTKSGPCVVIGSDSYSNLIGVKCKDLDLISGEDGATSSKAMLGIALQKASQAEIENCSITLKGNSGNPNVSGIRCRFVQGKYTLENVDIKLQCSTSAQNGTIKGLEIYTYDNQDNYDMNVIAKNLSVTQTNVLSSDNSMGVLISKCINSKITIQDSKIGVSEEGQDYLQTALWTQSPEGSRIVIKDSVLKGASSFSSMTGQIYLDNCSIEGVSTGIEGGNATLFISNSAWTGPLTLIGEQVINVGIGCNFDNADLSNGLGIINYTNELYRYCEETEDCEGKDYNVLVDNLETIIQNYNPSEVYYYANLADLAADLNSDTRVKYLTQDPVEQAVVKLYQGDNGKLNIQLLNDTEIAQKIDIQRPVDFNLNGYTINLGKTGYFRLTARNISLFGKGEHTETVEHSYINSQGELKKYTAYYQPRGKMIGSGKYCLTVLGGNLLVQDIDINVNSSMADVVTGILTNTFGEGADNMVIKNCSISVANAGYSSSFVAAVCGIRIQGVDYASAPSLTIIDTEIIAHSASAYAQGIEACNVIMKNCKVQASTDGNGYRGNTNKTIGFTAGVYTKLSFDGFNNYIEAKNFGSGTYSNTSALFIKEGSKSYIRDSKFLSEPEENQSGSDIVSSGVTFIDGCTFLGKGSIFLQQNSQAYVSNCLMGGVLKGETNTAYKIGVNCQFSADVPIESESFVYTDGLYRMVKPEENCLGCDFNILNQYLEETIISKLAYIVDGGV